MRSIRDGEACFLAAWLLREGSVVGTYLWAVCGLWAGSEPPGRDAGVARIGEGSAAT